MVERRTHRGRREKAANLPTFPEPLAFAKGLDESPRIPRSSVPFPRTWSPSTGWAMQVRPQEVQTAPTKPPALALETCAMRSRRHAPAPPRSSGHVDRRSEFRADKRTAPSRELIEKCAAAMAQIAADVQAGLIDGAPPPPSPAFKLVSKPPPQTVEQAIDALVLQIEGGVEPSNLLVLDGRPDYRLERRAYVPTSHGNGWCYNWKIEREEIGILRQSLKSYRKDGWRIGYMAHGDGFVAGYWDILWIADEDSNYNWGVLIARVQDLEDTVRELTAAHRRILHISPIEWKPDEPEATWLCVSWIEDGKYVDTFDAPDYDEANPSHWGVYLENTQTAERTLFVGSTPQPVVEIDDQGFRPIWISLCPPYILVVVVRDNFSVLWSIPPILSGGLDFDIRAALSGPEFEGLVPICIDCFPFPPGFGTAPSLYLWAAVLVEDPDLDSVTMPGQRWELKSATKLPGTNSVDNLQALRRRVLAFSTQPVNQEIKGKWVEKQVLVVEADNARAHQRSVTLYDSTPLPPAVEVLIDATIWNYMDAENLVAMTVAMEDTSGWRLRRGYTNAPLAWPDTYPESQIKVGSIAKLFTSAALLRALSENPNFNSAAGFASLKLFGDIFPVSSIDTSDAGYPPSALDTLLVDALGHRTRWSQGNFNPGYAETTIVKACDAAQVNLGYRAANGAVLLPFTRALYYYYVLNSVAFQQNPVWDDPDLSFVEHLRQSVGWGPGFIPATNAQNYSGWVLDYLALAVEEVSGIGNVDDALGMEYAGYWIYTRDSILDPLGMTNSIPSTTRRYQRIAPWEVTFPTGPYLEQAQLASNPFGETLLYSEFHKDSPETWYPIGEEPLDATTPFYVSRPYGGGDALRVERVSHREPPWNASQRAVADG